MAYRKRFRSQGQKLRRKSNERLSTLRSKIEELNALKENRAIMVWIDKDKDKTLACGDEQLLKSLGYTVRVRENRARHPTLSSTTSASSASFDRQSQHDQQIFEGRVFLGLQGKQPPVDSASGNGLRIKWRKEDLDLLASDFFSDN